MYVRDAGQYTSARMKDGMAITLVKEHAGGAGEPVRDRLRNVAAGYFKQKNFAAGAGPAGIGVVEMEAFPFKAVRIIEGCIEQVEDAFKICNDFHSLIGKYLVRGLLDIIKIHFITQSGTSAADHADPDKIVGSPASSCKRFSTRVLAASLINIPPSMFSIFLYLILQQIPGL